MCRLGDNSEASLACMWSALRPVIIRLRRFMRSVAAAALAAVTLTVVGASLPLRMTRSADIWKQNLGYLADHLSSGSTDGLEEIYEVKYTPQRALQLHDAPDHRMNKPRAVPKLSATPRIDQKCVNRLLLRLHQELEFFLSYAPLTREFSHRENFVRSR